MNYLAQLIRYSTLGLLLILTAQIKAQIPQKFSSQIVVRNASNELVIQGPVGLHISILQGTPDGVASYIETHQLTTNINGLVSMEVGTGIIDVGSFAGIDWSQGPFFIKTEIDPEGGDDYSISGTTELLSVPYAIRAETDDDWIVNGSDILAPLGRKVGIGTNNPSVQFEVGGNGRAFFGDGFGDQRSGLLLVGVNSGPVARIEAYDYGEAAPMSLGLNVSGGNVGIGTDSPIHTLHLESDFGDAYFGQTSGNASTGLIISAALTSDGGPATIKGHDYEFGSPKNIVLQPLVGRVGIGEVAPSVSLDVLGSIEYTGTITDVSDERLKENFEPIENAVESIIQLQGYSYNMKDDEEMTREYGVIAQEVQKVFPEMVTVVDEENGYLGVSYVQLIPVLLEAIKELQSELEKFKIENQALSATTDSQAIENAQLKTSQEYIVERMTENDRAIKELTDILSTIAKN